MTDELEDLWAEAERKVAAYGPIRRWLDSKSIHGYNGHYAIRHPLKMIRYSADEVRFFWQRGRRGYSLSDTWSLDDYLLSWLPDAIGELRDRLHGYPMSMHEELGHNQDLFKPIPDDHSDAAFERWEDTLTKIETGLRSGARLNDVLAYEVDEIPQLQAEFDEAWALLGKHFFSMWD